MAIFNSLTANPYTSQLIFLARSSLALHEWGPVNMCYQACLSPEPHAAINSSWPNSNASRRFIFVLQDFLGHHMLLQVTIHDLQLPCSFED